MYAIFHLPFCCLHFIFLVPLLAAAPDFNVSANPPLTPEIASKAAQFFEWALDIRFTPEQQQEYKRLLTQGWAEEGTRKFVLEPVRGLDKLAALSEEKKQQAHRQVQDALLSSMRKGSAGQDVRWLLAIYASAHAAGGLTPTFGGRQQRDYRELAIDQSRRRTVREPVARHVGTYQRQ